MPFHTDLMYAYNLTNKVIKTLERLEKNIILIEIKLLKEEGRKERTEPGKIKILL